MTWRTKTKGSTPIAKGIRRFNRVAKQWNAASSKAHKTTRSVKKKGWRGTFFSPVRMYGTKKR